MTRPRQIPDELRSGGAYPPSTGSFDGSWYIEKDCDSTLLGMRVDAVLHEEKSAYQKITVYDTPFFGRVLTLDDIIMLTERDEFVYHEMIVHVPLCQLQRPRSVLVVGGGDCGALREILKHPGIERAVQCEIDERVTRVCADHFDWVEETIADPRVELVFDDGAAYIDANPDAFDLIVIDSTDPVGPASALFLREFYARARRALRNGGILTAQGESPHWDAGMVLTMHEELSAAFKHTAGYLCFMPSYPSGCWHLAWASPDRAPDAWFDEARAAALAPRCEYYNAEIHRASFALPQFARRVIIDRENPFENHDRRVRTAPNEDS